VFEKPHQERNIEVLEAEIRRRSAQSFGGKLKQHAEGVAVSRDRVGAGAELSEQAIGKEPLNEGSQEGVAHFPPPARRLHKSFVANWSNSGSAEKYQ
jgi:hypothetical protein